MGGVRIKHFFVPGAFSAISFKSSDNVTVLVRFPAVLTCEAIVDDDIHVPLITWYRSDGTPIDTYVA